MSKLLFEYQQDCYLAEKTFLNKLECCEELLSSGNLTLREFLDLGFNNSNLLKPSDSNWKFNTGFRNSDNCMDQFGEYSKDLSDELLNVKVINASSAYEDLDGYYCMDIYCVNEQDYELFDKELEKNNFEL